jgi:hypothetical protein
MEDKSYSTFGIEVPKGTLMVTAQITDKEYYAELVANDQVGFSIEGFLGLKLSNQLNKYSMKLPDGEHLIEGKIYVVEGGEIVEIKDAPVTEEVAMEETVVEEEEIPTEDAGPEVTDEVVEEEMSIDPAMDSEAILAIVTPILEEREKAIIALIADLRNQMEEMMVGETEVEVEATDNKTKMSMQEKFSAVSKFLNTNN